MFCMSFSSNLIAAETPIIAVIAEPSLRDQSAMMTTVLATHKTIKLVEREELNRIIEEQKLHAEGLSRSDAMQLGKLLNADGLLIMRKSHASSRENIELRLVAVRPGIVISNENYSNGVFSFDGIEAVIAPQLSRLWPKLNIAPEKAIPLSFGGLHATKDGSEMKKWERELSLLLEHRLIGEPALYVLERKNMELLIAEKQWAANETELLTGHGLLEGSIEQKGDQIQIMIQLKQARGKENRELRVEGPIKDQAALVEKLVALILENLRTTPTTKQWSAIDEAKIYQEIAEWALTHHLFSEAQAAAESSWALGARSDALNEMRMKAYCLAAYPRWGTKGTGGFSNSYSFHGVDVRKEPQRLEAAIRATEILIDHLENQPRTQQDYSHFHDEGDSNFDYRILSARVLLNASRLLRSFYEDDAYANHTERLAYLRKLVRMAIEIVIRDETEIDERQIWIYRIQSAYAAYIYDDPEETVKVYRSLLNRNIEAWMFDRDPATAVWGPECKDKSDGCIRHRRAKNVQTPFVLGWNSIDEHKAGLMWKKYVNELKSSKSPQDIATYWVIVSSAETSPEDAATLHQFAWKHRAMMCDTRGRNFSWKYLEKSYARTNPTQEECRQFFEYLMQNGKMVDQLFAHNLLDQLDLSDEKIAKRMADLLESYLTRVSNQLSKEENKAYIEKARHWIGMPLKESYMAWKKNGYQQPVTTEPIAPYPQPLPNSLPVTRFWSSWTHLSGELKGSDLWGYQYADGKIWCYNDLGPSRILGIDLKTFETTTIDVPTSLYQHVKSLAVGGGRLFATWENTVNFYDFTTSQWTRVNVPSTQYSLQYIEPYCYLLFGLDAFYSSPGSEEVNASGVYRYNPKTGELKLLTSTRRRPALCELDSAPRYRPSSITKSNNGMLHFHIETDQHGYQHAFYMSDPEGDNWRKSFEIPKESYPVLYQNPGGLVCQLGPRAYRYLPNLAERNQLHALMINSKPQNPETPNILAWAAPKRVLEKPETRSIQSISEAFGSTWLLSNSEALISERMMSAYPFLHQYNGPNGQVAEIPLDTQIPQEQQTSIQESAQKSTDVAQVSEALRQISVPKLKELDHLIVVPDGFVFHSSIVNSFGFWHLPLTDIQKHIKKSESDNPSTTLDSHE